MADKDCYRCGQKGHISRNCPNGGKGGVNSFEEDAEYEEEAPEEGSEITPEWLGYFGKGEKESGWLGFLNSLEDDECKSCAGNLGTFEAAKKTVKSGMNNKVHNKGKVTFKNKFEELGEKEIVNKKGKEVEEINSMTGTWEPITITIDSGAGNSVAPRHAFPSVELQQNEDSRNGRYYTTANGKKVYVLGEKNVVIKSKEGVVKKMKYQICDVTRILGSVGKITKAGNEVNLNKTGGKIIDGNGDEINVEIENGVYVVKAYVKTSGFTRQGL
jgi:hypothetical protein